MTPDVQARARKTKNFDLLRGQVGTVSKQIRVRFTTAEDVGADMGQIEHSDARTVETNELFPDRFTREKSNLQLQTEAGRPQDSDSEAVSFCSSAAVPPRSARSGSEICYVLFLVWVKGAVHRWSLQAEAPSAVRLGVISEAAGSFLHVCPERPGNARGGTGAS